MFSLPTDVLCHIRGFAMPVHPCSKEIKSIKLDYINRKSIYDSIITFDSAEQFWYDFDWDKNGAWGEWEMDESLTFDYNAHIRYCVKWACPK
jgi:hypothetical protein